MEELCAKLPNRKIQKRKGALCTYEPVELDLQILEIYNNKHGKSLAGSGDYEEIKQHGPRQLNTKGGMSSNEGVDTVYIPIATEAQQSPELHYFPDKDDKNNKQIPQWIIGVPFFSPEGSRIYVQKGPIRFLMVVFVKHQDQTNRKTQKMESQEHEEGGRTKDVDKKEPEGKNDTSDYAAGNVK